MWFTLGKKQVFSDKHGGYFFHGTDGKNIPLILGQGLNRSEKNAVWGVVTPDLSIDELEDTVHGHLYKGTTTGRGISGLALKSMQGSYFSSNYMTALSAARRSIALRRKRAGLSIVDITKEPVGIIVAKLETSTPHIVLDEDTVRIRFESSLEDIHERILLHRVFSDDFIEKANFLIKEEYTYLAKNIIDSIVRDAIRETSYYRHAKEDESIIIPDFRDQFFSNLAPIAEEIIRAIICVWVAQRLINDFRIYKKALKNWQEDSDKQRDYPDEENILNQRIQEIRELWNKLGGIVGADSKLEKLMDNFLHKANRLTFSRNTFDSKFRVLTPVGFRGKNRIVFAAQLYGNDQGSRDVCLVEYMEKESENEVIDLILKQHKTRIGGELSIIYKGQEIART